MEIKNEYILTTSHQAFILFFGLFIENILKYVFTIIMGRTLGAELLGRFFIGIAVVTFAATLSRFGMDMGIVRYASLYQGRQDRKKCLGVFFGGLKVSCLISICVTFFLVFFAEHISLWIFKDLLIVNVIRYLSVSIPISTFVFIAIAYFQANQEMKYQVYLMSILQPVVNILLFIAFLLIIPKLSAAIVSYVLALLISAVTGFYYLKEYFHIFKEKADYNYDKKGFILQSAWLFLMLMLGFLIRWSDTFILGHFRGANEVGIYNVSMRVAVMCGILSTMFISIFAPVVSRLHDQQEKAQLSLLLKVINRWILSLTLPIFILFVVYPQEILSVFGKEFTSGYLAFVILSASYLFVSVSDTVAYSLLVMTGNAKLSFYNNLAGALVSVILNFLFIPRYGIVGAATANLIAFSLMGLLTVSEVYFLFKIHPYHLNLLRPVAAGFIAYITLTILKNYTHAATWYVISGQLLLFLAIYVLILGLRKEDKQALNALRDRFMC